MNGELAPLHKGLRAVLALERSLAGVVPKVDFEMAPLRESFAAFLADVGPWLAAHPPASCAPLTP